MGAWYKISKRDAAFESEMHRFADGQPSSVDWFGDDNFYAWLHIISGVVVLVSARAEQFGEGGGSAPGGIVTSRVHYPAERRTVTFGPSIRYQSDDYNFDVNNPPSRVAIRQLAEEIAERLELPL